MKFYILYDVGAVSQYDYAKIVEAVDLDAALRMAFEEGYKELNTICRNGCRGMSFNAYPIFEGVDLTDKNTHGNLCNGALTPTALNMLEFQMMGEISMKIKFKHTFELLVNDGYRNIPTIVEEGSTWTIDSIRDIGESKGHLFMIDRGHTQFLISDYNMELIKDE